MAENINNTYHGQCLCKNVQFQLDGEPFQYVICHCKNCKRSSGSSFLPNAMFKPFQLRIVQGEDTLEKYADRDTLSGNIITRIFCRKCGSSLFVKPAKEGIIIVYPGSLTSVTEWVPRKEIHIDDKYSWVKEINFRAKHPSKL
ncbi:DUF636 domain-containing protein [Crucibulum laeve]|uniref:DUF636 domain-containing protein n=1 Tax=Crucibulum laeve TaxID=68775 RepID=A0A5C3M2A8_9AGAR|nr:DUF636 domain-containing protein [Crucibulum laeve]